ncbi:MAG TPA: hypothetical protein VK432_09030 [Stellaceae bacterium]|nr:hypothetical protein [Stellaceae bacterium]
MITRLLVTAMLLLLAAANFCGGVLFPPGLLNPFGLLCLAGSGAIWFGWEVIEDAYAYQEERRREGKKIPHPLFVRFAPALSPNDGAGLPPQAKDRRMPGEARGD